jgi:hypothetical protein
MTLDEILRDIHAMEEDLLTYERKYGVLSDTFYESYRDGEEPADDAWVLDWGDWAGAYEIWLRRRQQYQEAMNTLKAKSKLSSVIERAARREPLPIPA